ncbi:ATP-binding cassette domain-containing protein [Peribacillus huizhouensis]|uniref:ABC-2 type transport system ATP-binding protein n=1 Tax=Peribacillus huizhouensis TaxID=1501239 RepID=A0ABR6CP12_9BACI|nr:ABC transporter ATP-binding protein [Peribacillus huizhouensis]MBA9026777.1 ABC-2 type transport system ATP-binding protein [Peribacillus huizhouensis]
MQPWLEMKGLKKKIDDFQLGPIDLTVQPGTITALVGNNGAGKSTLLKTMMNLVKPEEGVIHLFGKEFDQYEDHWNQRIAYQPQSLIGCNAFNGKELMTFISKWYPKWDQNLFMHLVDLFDIPIMKRYVKLSPGVRQKLNLALSLSRDTEVMVLDEPTAQMDIPAKQMLMDVLVEWMEREDKALIIATHQVEDIRKLADYVVIMKNGKMIGQFLKEELTTQYKRYWMEQPLSFESVPGEITRKGDRLITTSRSNEAERYFLQEKLAWIESESMELEEIITVLLGDHGERKRPF